MTRSRGHLHAGPVVKILDFLVSELNSPKAVAVESLLDALSGADCFENLSL